MGDQGLATANGEVPWLVSVDDHVVEPPDLFERWLPSRYRADAPRVIRRGIAGVEHVGGGYYRVVWDDDAPLGDAWVFRDYSYVHRPAVLLLNDVDLTTNEFRTSEPCTYDQMRPGCYVPSARLADMTANHVEASLGFPTMPRFCGQVFTEQTPGDRDLGLALVQAYNDWHVEEWCGDSGGRLIPLCVVPLWDATLAAAEVRRNAARGVRAVTFSEIPYHLGLPSIHSGAWDPFFEACDETGTVVCMHIGSSSKMPATSPDAPQSVTVTLSFGNSMASLTDFLFSGVLSRYPNLRLAYSEGQIGWIPYILERVDAAWTDHPWARRGEMTEPPSSYFRRQVYGCFFSDRHGVRSIDEIGEDNVLFETDYPHADGSFPFSERLFAEQTAGLAPDVVRKVARGNAIRLFGLDLAP